MPICECLMKCVIIFEVSKQTHLNQITFHNLQSHLAYQHTKLWVLFRHTLYKNLVKIHYLRHEKVSIMYENSSKMQQNQESFHNLQLHLVCQYIKMSVLIRYIFCKSLVKTCATQHKCRTFL